VDCEKDGGKVEDVLIDREHQAKGAAARKREL
jgi:hypothetical protein